MEHDTRVYKIDAGGGATQHNCMQTCEQMNKDFHLSNGKQKKNLGNALIYKLTDRLERQKCIYPCSLVSDLQVASLVGSELSSIGDVVPI